MAKRVQKSGYIKSGKAGGYMRYIATREGVEKIDNTFGLLPATVKQKELIADILSKIEDAERLGYDSAAQWQALLRSREMPMQWQTWVRCMHRASLWKQTRQKHRNGMKRH